SLPVNTRFYDALMFFVTSRTRHTTLQGDWTSDVCSSDLLSKARAQPGRASEPSKGPLRKTIRRQDATHRTTRRQDEHFRRMRPQIGRASCRERVAVLDVGGA